VSYLAVDQCATLAFLSAGDSYGLPGASVRRIETHWSDIFLVGDRAYKLKRQAAFSLLDYGTVEKRERACRSELDVNASTAPDLYLGVRKISRLSDGALTFDGDGPAVDWLVVMRRFDQSDLFDHLADARRLSACLMHRLADEIAAFHARAEMTRAHGGIRTMQAALERWRAEQIAVDGVFDDGQSESYDREVSRIACELEQVLELRRTDGRVRRCHGDLRLANICLLDGRPTLFDAIEFSEELACIDVLYDLAFLLMDLHHRGLADLENLIFNRYFDVNDDAHALRVLALFLSFRAAMRAQMLAATAMRRADSTASHHAAMARSHLQLAMSLLRRRFPRLIAIGGLGSAAKSELATRLAPTLGPAPGARIIRGYVVRRHVMGARSEARLPRSAFDEAVTVRLYDAIAREAATTLAAGFTAIVDADFLNAQERHTISDVAAATGVPFTGLWWGEPEDWCYRQTTTLRDWHWIDPSRGPYSALAAAQAITEFNAPPRR
jgi:aminoglycoside phosphotransferase family enzyme/predicted kinase